MFFYANRTTSIEEADFWEKSYLFRQTRSPESDSELSAPVSISGHGTVTNEKKERSSMDIESCPLFIKDMAKAIVSAGKSLQLIRHIPISSSATTSREKDYELDDNYGNSKDGFRYGQDIAGLTLSEVFCISFAGLIGHGDHIFKYLCRDDSYKTKSFETFGCLSKKEKVESNERELLPTAYSEKIWYQLLVDTLSEKGLTDLGITYKNRNNDASEEKETAVEASRLQFFQSFCAENPVITVCQETLSRNRDAWKILNISRNFNLPPLNDEVLRKAVFGEECGSISATEGTNYSFGFHFGESEYLRSHDDSKMLEMLFPFPTVLPSYQVLFYFCL